MKQLLEFVAEYFSFLFDELGAKLVDSDVGSIGSALVILQLGDARLRFVNDRGQILLYFQSVHRGGRDEWFSFDVVRQLITRVVDDDGIMWGRIDGDPQTDHQKALSNATFIKTHFTEIADAFSDARHVSTEETLHEYKEARGKRLFG
jgi:hypothetical protein